MCHIGLSQIVIYITSNQDLYLVEELPHELLVGDGVHVGAQVVEDEPVAARQPLRQTLAWERQISDE